MLEQEILLSKEEIKTIILAVKNNPQLRIPNIVTMMKCGRELATVYWVSNNKGLIWIKGNKDTGLEHITDRHNWSSEKQYWSSKQIDKLDNPSRFDRVAYPAKHLDRIAEEVFCKENLNTLKNQRTEVFDVYDGESYYELEELKTKFRLIVYKDTPIVHTLIPIKGEKKIRVNLKRGNCKGKMIQENNEMLYIIAVPYRNQKGEALYSFQIIYNVTTKQEKWYIINQRNNDNWTVFERKIEKIVPINELIEVIQISELPEIEKFISKQLETNANKY